MPKLQLLLLSLLFVGMHVYHNLLAHGLLGVW